MTERKVPDDWCGLDFSVLPRKGQVSDCPKINWFNWAGRLRDADDLWLIREAVEEHFAEYRYTAENCERAYLQGRDDQRRELMRKPLEHWRFQAACAAMQAMLSRPDVGSTEDLRGMAGAAVRMADMLLTELRKEKDPT